MPPLKHMFSASHERHLSCQCRMLSNTSHPLQLLTHQSRESSVQGDPGRGVVHRAGSRQLSRHRAALRLGQKQSSLLLSMRLLSALLALTG